MRDHQEATRLAQEAVRRAREAGIQAHIRACKAREQADKRIALSKALREKSQELKQRTAETISAQGQPEGR